MSMTPWTMEDDDREIADLLDVDDLAKYSREEIPPEHVKRALQYLMQDREYERIIFENSGELCIANFGVLVRLPFEMMALRHERKNWFQDYLVLNLSPRTSSSVYVRSPSFWRNNVDHERDPSQNREDNCLRFNLDSFLRRVELKVSAKPILGQRSKAITYEVPGAVGYKLNFH